MNIAVAGIGYVGLSNAILLSQYNNVVAYDIDADKVNLINQRISPIEDNDIEEYFQKKQIKIHATTDDGVAFKEADYVIIATPTDYNPQTNFFNTSSIEAVIKSVLKHNKNALIVIKSTIPIGYTKKIREVFNYKDIIFSPEFLREGKALHDNLHPSRIIIGQKTDKAITFANLLKEGAKKQDIEILFTGSNEAEAVKLFSNTYLAMRVSFFNELDSFAEINKMDTKEIIKGMSHDPRIGSHYNNPSFGYGGYCLPKDTKQLLANFKNVPNAIIDAIVRSNSIRKNHITQSLLKMKKNTIGIYRLIMKTGSDNYRDSSIIGIVSRLIKEGIRVVIYEPQLKDEDINRFSECKIINDLEAFKEASDIIVANRIEKEIEDITEKIYTRDIFNLD